MKYLKHRIVSVCVAVMAAPICVHGGESLDVILVVGAPGEEEFAGVFAKTVEQWEAAVARGSATMKLIGRDGEGENDLDQLKEILAEALKDDGGALWIVLVGHGTFDGREAKFNLRGPDLDAGVLKKWLDDSQRPVAIINTSASSGPFIPKLSAAGRIVVSATKSGTEDSFARFGEFFAGNFMSPAADIDQDGAVSLLEAFLAASKQVEEFYEKEGRIVTEHALLDDNGDGLGTPADWFRGVRSTKKPKKKDASPDGLVAHRWHLIPSEEDLLLTPQARKQRDALEDELVALREKKDSMKEEAYFKKLEAIVRQLAEIYAASGDDDS